MTKKDYIAIAKLINFEVNRMYDLKNSVVVKGMLRRICTGLCILFRNDNPRFDKDRFVKACELYEYERR